jgi:hypothetical protein
MNAASGSPRMVFVRNDRENGSMIMRRRICVLAVCAGLAAALVWGNQATASTPSTFTYQGQLLQGGEPFTGTVNLDFRLFAGSTAGAALGHLTAPNVPVTGGLVTIDLDFGTAAFGGEERWLEIQVNGITLSPRQPVMAAPYALYARSAHGPSITGINASNITSGQVPASVMTGTYNLAGSFTGSGAGLTSLNASNISSGTLGAGLLSGTYANALTLNNAANAISGTFTGSGAGLTSLNASNITTGTLANARTTGTAASTPSTLVLRDAGGGFSAGPITAAFIGNGSALINLNAGNITTGVLDNARTTGTPDSVPNTLVLRDSSGRIEAALNASSIVIGTLTNARTTGTAANTANTLVLRDASGNFAAGSITGTFAGGGAGLTGLNAGNIATGTLANARTTGTAANTASTLVLRDASGNFAAGTITGTFSGPGAGLTGLSAGNISTGTLANARTTGTVANTPNTLVLRDASGNFAAGNITGTFSGSGAGLTGLSAASITSGTLDNARTTGTPSATPNTLMVRDNEGSVNVQEISANTARLDFGSNTVPTLRFHGENSGLSSPVAETVAILTASTERVRVTALGRVGIGVPVPAATLHVAWGTSGMGLNVPGIRVWQNADSPNIIGGHVANVVGGGTSTFGAAIAGGGSELLPNLVGAKFATVGGGEDNHVTHAWSTVSGGYRGRATATLSTVGGGDQNNATGFMSTVGGGGSNYAMGENSTVAGGYQNLAQGYYATVPGGRLNSAVADYTFAAGLRAKANHSGAFVWSDYGTTDFTSTAANQFNVRAAGGVRIFSNTGATVGVQLASGGSAWSALSDREAKRDVVAVDAREVAARLAEIPISRWTYIDDESGTPHMGPMAQDFHAAFGLGHSDKHLTTTDVDGVALAAIQGVYQMVRDRDARIAQQAAELADLRERLAAMEALVQALAENR